MITVPLRKHFVLVVDIEIYALTDPSSKEYHDVNPQCCRDPLVRIATHQIDGPFPSVSSRILDLSNRKRPPFVTQSPLEEEIQLESKNNSTRYHKRHVRLCTASIYLFTSIN